MAWIFDPQAVEVTKLSLLLKVLEDESAESLNKSLALFHERALPDLDDNIKCGNSLIGPDFFEGRLDLDDEERRRINPFDWQQEFSVVYKQGGFDAVIGNPPYVYRNALDNFLREYFVHAFTCTEGNYDLYKFFVERGLQLLRQDGLLGMIVSATFLVQTSFQKLRTLLLSTSQIERLAPLGPRVFAKATVDTAILIARRRHADKTHEIVVQAPQVPTELPATIGSPVPQMRFAANEGAVFDYRLSREGARLVRRLFEEFPPIETGYEFGVGINTGFIREELVADRKVDARFHPMVAGDGISRFGMVRCSGWIMYDAYYVRGRGKLNWSPENGHHEVCYCWTSWRAYEEDWTRSAIHGRVSASGDQAGDRGRAQYPAGGPFAGDSQGDPWELGVANPQG